MTEFVEVEDGFAEDDLISPGEIAGKIITLYHC